MTARRAIVAPPPHLRPASAVWFSSVIAEYELEAHHVHLLTLAAEALDRAAEAREGLAKHGSVFTDRYNQPRARPEVAIAREASIQYARLLRELGLDVEGPAESPRPPRVVPGSHRRKGV